MTAQDKEKIRAMRLTGKTYAFIATSLSISESTIRVYCTRNGLTGKQLSNGKFCRCCGRIMDAPSRTKPKVFCCEECRRSWWKSHPECISRKAIYSFSCAECGTPFSAYGNQKRKYCSHACYIKQRYRKEVNDE